MKLLSKLTLFTTLSKVAILLLFVALLPYLIDRVASNYTTYQLRQQEEKVFSNIRENGVDYYLDGDSTYGSYTMLKEEYIALASAELDHLPDTILTTQRVIEDDTLNYRVLSRTFQYEGRNYNLEIGKTLASISQYNRPLQRVALFVLGSLIILTLLGDLAYTRILLRPLSTIIRTKLVNIRFPFKENAAPVHTTTTDFKYLDDSLIALMQRIKADFDREREFTSNASHELMTPIGILQNKMENMLLGSEDEELQEKLMDSMKTLNRLKKIVNSLLLISRIENEQYNRGEKINSRQLVEEVTGELQHRIDQKEIQLNVSLKDDVMLAGLNHDLIFQLLHNLINNAIRYNNDHGKIVISDERTHDSYTLIISDTGIGISADDLPTIFDRFKKTKEDGEGYGLGLSIVKSIADYHKLKITVDSEVGRGTSFRVIFPL